MKKGLFALPAAALLASCGGLSSDGSLYVHPGSVQLQSTYTVSGAAYNGTSYTGPVVCLYRPTNMQLSLQYSGDLYAVDVLLEGSNGGQGSDIKVTSINNDRIQGNLAIGFDTGSGTVPFSKSSGSISTQGIIVVPSANVIGATRIVLRGRSSTNATTGEFRTNYVPVVDNCP